MESLTFRVAFQFQDRVTNSKHSSFSYRLIANISEVESSKQQQAIRWARWTKSTEQSRFVCVVFWYTGELVVCITRDSIECSRKRYSPQGQTTKDKKAVRSHTPPNIKQRSSKAMGAYGIHRSPDWGWFAGGEGEFGSRNEEKGPASS